MIYLQLEWLIYILIKFDATSLTTLLALKRTTGKQTFKDLLSFCACRVWVVLTRIATIVIVDLT